jgi:hypothetical protein
MKKMFVKIKESAEEKLRKLLSIFFNDLNSIL